MTALHTTEGAQAHACGSAGYRGVTLALFAAGLTTFMSMYATQALLPALSRSFRVTPATAALSVSLTTGFLALALIPAGVLSERFGRTRVMAASAALSSAIGLLLPLSPTMGVLLCGRALQGVALAGVPAVAMAYLAEEVHSGSLSRAMGRYVAGTSLGGLAGRIIPSCALDVVSWRIAMETASAAALVLTVLFIRSLPPSRFFRPAPLGLAALFRSLGGHLRDPSLGCLFALGFLLMGGFVTVYNYLGYRLTSAPFCLSETVVGLVFVLYLAGTFASAQAGRLADRVGRAKTLAWAAVVTAAGLAITLPDSLWAVLLGMLLFTAGFFAAHSTASGWVSRIATQNRAGASSLYLFAYYMGSALAGGFGGFAYSRFGWDGVAGFVGVFLVVGFALIFCLTRRARSGVRAL
ncbi:major facilitator superfamily MFS_1 [Segniliparus rotundus DSM 44985]|uniref:Major facilitator superfamily MFS_1 n=1 Tax=Segniliparus rotundus (strain ATCC BAA-972 / CDC 1076 / CIP 108378 / DSM 44985 / JCM 13578) TaxID=640132 RepID=D6ZD85_SEGRD|nr:MFS transporter [Segniliparus rotundus]ADG97149.1 major facilitator superfamily MFS_1 [Segniliparus rotundus DSM 44985]